VTSSRHKKQSVTGGQLTCIAHPSSLIPHGPLVVRRQVQPRKLLGRTRKWQSPLCDTPRNSHTSPKCATTSTSLRPAWRLRASRHIEKRDEGRNMCEPVRRSHTLRSPERPVPFILKSLLRGNICHDPCDWSDPKSLSAHSPALRTTPEARVRSKNCTTTAGAALNCRSRRIFSERRQIQPVTVLRAGTGRQPAANEPICDAVTHVTHRNGARSRASELRERTHV
jgi:hypothetical protein